MRHKNDQVTGYNIGLTGWGFLGRAFEYALSPKNNIMIDDIAYEIDGKKFFSKFDICSKCDIILVAVPTPYSEKDGYIPDILNSVIKEYNEIAVVIDKRPVICIKSAVLPSHVTELIEKYQNIDITISPEYLSGRDSIRDMINCDVLIVGGKEEACDKVIDLFQNHSVIRKDLKVAKCTAQEAALIKYMTNCFLAMKCYWLSEFAEFYENMNGNTTGYNEIIRQFQFDERVGNYPYKIPYEGSLGYCSLCLEKDIPSIVKESYKIKDGSNGLELMAFVHEMNEIKFRKNYHPYCNTHKYDKNGCKISYYDLKGI